MQMGAMRVDWGSICIGVIPSYDFLPYCILTNEVRLTDAVNDGSSGRRIKGILGRTS